MRVTEEGAARCAPDAADPRARAAADVSQTVLSPASVRLFRLARPTTGFQDRRLGHRRNERLGDTVCILRCWNGCARTLELEARRADILKVCPASGWTRNRIRAHSMLQVCLKAFSRTTIDKQKPALSI